MAAVKRLNITSLLAGIESTYKTDPGLTGAANAILLSGAADLSPMEMQTAERDLLLSFYSNAEVLPGAVFSKLKFSFEAAGSGTAGTAAAHAPVFRMCGFSQTINPTPITGTAQVGGTSTSINLAAGASATDDFYVGMPISITAGAGNGNFGLICAYNGTSKVATVVSQSWVATDNTSQYSIGACTVYRRVSTNFESGALYTNYDGLNHIMLGARGSLDFSLGVNGIPKFDVNMQGLYVPITDATMPTNIYTAWKKPQIASRVNTPLVSLHNFAAGLESFNYNSNTEINYNDLINSTEEMLITGYKPKGKINMQAVAIADKDWFTTIQSSTNGTFGLQHGTVSGNKMACVAPAVSLVSPAYGGRNGIRMFNADLNFNHVNGNDNFVFSFF